MMRIAFLVVFLLLGVVGAAQDTHACKTDKGLYWSEIKDKCYRWKKAREYKSVVPWMKGSAWVLLSEDLSKAEILLPETDKAIVLPRTRNYFYSDGTYELVVADGKTLSKNGTIIFDSPLTREDRK